MFRFLLSVVLIVCVLLVMLNNKTRANPPFVFVDPTPDPVLVQPAPLLVQPTPFLVQPSAFFATPSYGNYGVGVNAFRFNAFNGYGGFHNNAFFRSDVGIGFNRFAGPAFAGVRFAALPFAGANVNVRVGAGGFFRNNVRVNVNVGRRFIR